MRAFAWNHPNLMVAFFAVLWLCSGALMLDAPNWWARAFIFIGNVYWFIKAGEWYGRTGGPK